MGAHNKRITRLYLKEFLICGKGDCIKTNGLARRGAVQNHREGEEHPLVTITRV